MGLVLLSLTKAAGPRSVFLGPMFLGGYAYNYIRLFSSSSFYHLDLEPPVLPKTGA